MTLLLAAALLIVTGCKKDDNNVEGERMTFSAGFDNGGAKTEINGLDMLWNKGDAVMINGKTFTADEGGAITTLSGEKTHQEGGLYKAYYPASIWNSGTLTLPATQAYNGTNLSGVNPMYAQSENTNLTFSNLCALVKLQLTGSKTVTEIRVSADQPLSGEFEIAEVGAGYKAVMKSQIGNAGVSLNCAGVSLSSNNVFYVALPEGAYTNLEFLVLADDNTAASIEKASATLVANNIYELVRTPEFHEAVKPTNVTINAECVDCNYTVSGSVTVPSGSHTCEYGLVYCPTSAGHYPTIADSKIVVNTGTISGTNNFTVDLGVLETGVIYYVRTYGMIEGVEYSSVLQTIGGNVPQPMTWIGGKSPKRFSVSSTKTVYFSQGNLQYIGSAATPYWKFADHQTDYFGATTGQGSDAQNVDRDLFGWGTSGWDNGNHYYQPYDTQGYVPDLYSEGSGYGPTNGSSYDFSLTGEYANADWGVYNTIQNGKGSDWRTPTIEEWHYLINLRPNADKLLAFGRIGCNAGLIILPDDWELPEGLTFFPTTETSGLNRYDYFQWKKMEAAGAVFLPSSGWRCDTELWLVGSYAHYHSSSACGVYAYSLETNTSLCSIYTNDRCYDRAGGHCVRLVSDN